MKKVKGLASLKIKIPHKDATTRPTAPRPEVIKPAQIVGGMLMGKKASAPEIVLATVLNKYFKQYAFRYVVPEVPGHFGLSGDKEVDFLISDGVIKPVQVADFTFIHKSPEQKAKDDESDIRVNSYFSQYGALPVVWIDAVDLTTPEVADFTCRRIGLI